MNHSSNSLFHSIFQHFFECNSFLECKFFEQLNDELDIYYKTYLIIKNICTSNPPNKDAILKQFNEIPLINQHLNNNDLPKTLEILLHPISEIYEYLVHAYSVERGILIYTNQSTDLIENKFTKLHSNKTEFENQTQTVISKLNSLLEIDISDSIESIISKNYEKTEQKYNEKSAQIDKLRDSHHMCLICNIYPAVYYSTPCMHPCFCVNCMNEFAQKKFVYNRCLNCQALVKSIETLSFLQKQ